jgi:hypothetical protein
LYNNLNNENNIPTFKDTEPANFDMDNNNNLFINNNEDINLNNEITLKFAFSGAQVYMVKANPNEKISTIIERFKNRQCPEELKIQLNNPYHSGQKIKKQQKNKTLSQLNIKNNDIILFTMEDNNEENDDRELTQGEKLTLKNLVKGIETFANIISILANKNVKEHNHYLVYLITDFNWKCNLCNTSNNKNTPRYYCSLCNFNMCKECYAVKEYPKMKEFPPGIITPSNNNVNQKFLDTDYHKHKLVYCRSSRHQKDLNTWKCDNCNQSFNNEDWSFYCTNCDYDLCGPCCGYN